MAAVYGSLYNDNATYGQDTVAFQSQGSNADSNKELSAPGATLALLQDYYTFTLGSLGLAFGEIDGAGAPVPSFMETLANTSMIPSRSWAYTAGAVYRKLLFPL